MKFETMKIADLISEISMGPFGSNIKVECFVEKGVPVLNGSNLDGFVLKEDSFRYVTTDKADSLGKANAHRGDVVITHRGTLGQIVFIPQNSLHDRYVISQSQFRVKCNDKILPEYLVYYFHTRIGQHKLLANASQVGVPALARASTTFQTIEIEVPELKHQRKIVDLLEIIRQKIEVNNAINENLQAQAQALFKSWFVDFEPFGGVMPDDWKMGTLSDICGYSKDKVNVAELTLDTYFSTENMQPNRQGALQATTLPTIKQTTACKKGDTLISNIRPYFKKILYCHSDCGCSTDVLCFVPNVIALSSFLFCTLYSDKFFGYMVAGSKGTKMPRGDKQQIMMYPICIPSTEYIEKFSSVVAPMLENIYANRLESHEIAIIRDTLLPKLMSGEIDVSDLDL